MEAASDARSAHEGGTMDAGGVPFIDASFDAPLSDAGMHSCPTYIPDICEPGSSSDECYDWAYRVGAGYIDQSAVFICEDLSASIGECVRASYCSDWMDAGSCECGDGPACGTGQVCARRSVTSRLQCLPCRAD